MQREDRTWTAVVAEAGLDRAQPLLRLLKPSLFNGVDLAAVVRATGEPPTAETPFRGDLEPRLRAALGAEADAVIGWLASLPFGGGAERPAADFWWLMWPDLRGEDAPPFANVEGAHRWEAFVRAWRGRLGPETHAAWLRAINDDALFARGFRDVVTAQRQLALTAHDRALYARFGWNDAGDMRGLSSFTQAVSLERARRAWLKAAAYFDADEQHAIEHAAHRVRLAENDAAWNKDQPRLATEAARYGITPDQMESDSYAPPAPPPPLSTILSE